MRKYEVARLLALSRGLSSYLEIATPTTGTTYSRIDAKQFTRRKRVVYRCLAGQSKEDDTDILSGEESSEAALAAVLDSGERFDLVFVDPWHSYAASRLDIEVALRLVRPGGIVLVHDCNPASEDSVTPHFREGDWCGRTFAAYLDIVLGTPALDYFTVDCDHGCGVICKTAQGARPLFKFARKNTLGAEWRAVDDDRKYSFLDADRAALLRLVSPKRLRLQVAMRNLTVGQLPFAALRRMS